MNQDGKKTDRRVRYTKMVLKESLLELMQQKPISKISTTELCRLADINRNTFYAHYDSPEDLLNSIESELYEKWKTHSKELNGTNNLSSILAESCQNIRNSKELRIIVSPKYGDMNFLQKLIDVGREPVLENWVKAGIGKDDEQREMLYRFAVNGGLATIQNWLLEGMKKTPHEIAAFIEKTTYSGINSFCVR